MIRETAETLGIITEDNTFRGNFALLPTLMYDIFNPFMRIY